MKCNSYVILFVFFTMFIFSFTACFTSDSQEKDNGGTGKLTVSVSGAQVTTFISFGVFETVITFEQMLDPDNYDPIAWGAFTSDASGNGSSPAFGYDANAALLQNGDYALGVLQDSNGNGDPDTGEKFAMKNIAIDGDTDVTVTGAEFSLTVP